MRWRGSIGESKRVIFTGVIVGFAGLVGNVGVGLRGLVWLFISGVGLFDVKLHGLSL